GATWERASTTRLPEVLSLDISADGDGDPKFIAGTQSGFFTSNDAVEWTQSSPVNATFRADKILRFNRARLFAATSDGVFTSRDGGKAWYRLANAGNRTVDLTLGTLANQRVLFALTDAGVTMFDGEKWTPI